MQPVGHVRHQTSDFLAQYQKTSASSDRRAKEFLCGAPDHHNAAGSLELRSRCGPNRQARNTIQYLYSLHLAGCNPFNICRAALSAAPSSVAISRALRIDECLVTIDFVSHIVVLISLLLTSNSSVCVFVCVSRAADSHQCKTYVWQSDQTCSVLDERAADTSLQDSTPPECQPIIIVTVISILLIRTCPGYDDSQDVLTSSSRGPLTPGPSMVVGPMARPRPYPSPGPGGSIGLYRRSIRTQSVRSVEITKRCKLRGGQQRSQLEAICS
ncbi:hypothetical protein RRG08_024821 [Elysia crispata]|uniref:Uncharacterized protein n=1 Tax=Elysia crispata TaxID=231223 RepID=A0AAE0YJ94_9GAST|nr:hypothetical protein RRG08_024821 [Elysia crispata]